MNAAEWCLQNIRSGYVSPAVEQDERPVVMYKQRDTEKIEVGYRAFIIPVNHYAENRVTNGRIALTSTVLAHDVETGAFETKNTRYVLDTSYVH